MPPRYAYWTILIDGKPTAFRAHERDELMPTFNQLARKNADIVMRYFSHGKLWDSPEQAQWARTTAQPPRERRGPDWRPGGTHEDPRARFDKKKNRDHARGDRTFRKPEDRPRRDPPRADAERPQGERRVDSPRFDKPRFDKPRFDKPRFDKRGDRPDRPFDKRDDQQPGGDRPFRKPYGKPRTERPAGGSGQAPSERRFDKPRGDKPRFDRPRFDKPRFDPRGERPDRPFDKRSDPPPRSDGPFRKPYGKPRPERPVGDSSQAPNERRFDKPRFDKPRFDKPRFDKPRGDRPPSDKARFDRPRSDKPRSDERDDRGDKPRTPPPSGGGSPERSFNKPRGKPHGRPFRPPGDHPRGPRHDPRKKR